ALAVPGKVVLAVLVDRLVVLDERRLPLLLTEELVAVREERLRLVHRRASARSERKRQRDGDRGPLAHAVKRRTVHRLPQVRNRVRNRREPARRAGSQTHYAGITSRRAGT